MQGNNDGAHVESAHRVRVARQLFLLLAACLVGMALLAGFALHTLRDTTARIRAAESRARVNGQLYTRIIRGKDLLADVLPPPAYIIEAYLTACRVCEATNAADRETLARQFPRLRQEYDERMAFWSREMPEGELKAAVMQQALPPARRFFQALEEEFLPALTQDPARARELLRSRLEPEYNHQRQAIDRVVALVSAETVGDQQELARILAASEAEVQRTLRQAFLGSLAAVLVLTTGVAAFGWRTSRRLTRAIRDIAHQLGAEAHEVADAARQLSRSSHSVAEGAGSQAAALQETCASLQELTAQTTVNVEHSRRASHLADQAREAAESGATHMAELDRSIQEINASSGDISRITRTIDEIAFQTNLLALNAAVEAARAGDAGLGFAVVADEVRTLARRCAQAAKETAGKIEGALGRTARGTELSRQVALAFQDILQHTRAVNDLDAEVAAGSQEQSKGLGHINAAVLQIDQVTQVNAASAEESAAAAETLQAQADAMHSAVNRLMAMASGSEPEPSPAPPPGKAPRRAGPTPPSTARTSATAQPAPPPALAPAPIPELPPVAPRALNCWEFKRCGREAGGAKAHELGVCPAYPDHGRDCAALAGTLCGGRVQGTFASKIGNCIQCDFYRSGHYTTNAERSGQVRDAAGTG